MTSWFGSGGNEAWLWGKRRMGIALANHRQNNHQSDSSPSRCSFLIRSINFIHRRQSSNEIRTREAAEVTCNCWESRQVTLKRRYCFLYVIQWRGALHRRCRARKWHRVMCVILSVGGWYFRIFCRVTRWIEIMRYVTWRQFKIDVVMRHVQATCLRIHVEAWAISHNSYLFIEICIV